MIKGPKNLYSRTYTPESNQEFSVAKIGRTKSKDRRKTFAPSIEVMCLVEVKPEKEGRKRYPQNSPQ